MCEGGGDAQQGAADPIWTKKSQQASLRPEPHSPLTHSHMSQSPCPPAKLLPHEHPRSRTCSSLPDTLYPLRWGCRKKVRNHSLVITLVFPQIKSDIWEIFQHNNRSSCIWSPIFLSSMTIMLCGGGGAAVGAFFFLRTAHGASVGARAHHAEGERAAAGAAETRDGTTAVRRGRTLFVWKVGVAPRVINRLHIISKRARIHQVAAELRVVSNGLSTQQ